MNMKQKVQHDDKLVALLTGVRSDSHTWGLTYMHLLLEERGFRAINIGANSSTKEVTDAANNNLPEIIVVSSVNGHGFIEGQELAEALEAEGLGNVTKVIGGILPTDPNEIPVATEALLLSGFDAVFNGPESVQRFLTFLDLVHAKRSRTINKMEGVS